MFLSRLKLTKHKTNKVYTNQYINKGDLNY